MFIGVVTVSRFQKKVGMTLVEPLTVSDIGKAGGLKECEPLKAD